MMTLNQRHAEDGTCAESPHSNPQYMWVPCECNACAYTVGTRIAHAWDPPTHQDVLEFCSHTGGNLVVWSSGFPTGPIL
jgi:hypothetical protein